MSFRRRPFSFRTRSKYSAVRTEIDGVKFASKKEARRYVVLRDQERAGEIRALRLQVRYKLHAGSARGFAASGIEVGDYVADFTYEERDGSSWRFVVEDVKGMRLPLYTWKKRHLYAEYGIKIKET